MTMDQERQLKEHLAELDAQTLANAKAHAAAATHEEHDSFKAIGKWVAGIVGVPLLAGGIWKAIKVISQH